MSGLTDDWDSIPVKENSSKPSSNSITADWDSTPVKIQKSANEAPVYTGSEGAQQGQRIVQYSKDVAGEVSNGNLGSVILGVAAGDAGLNLATGLGSSAIGGLTSLYKLATGSSASDAAESAQNIQRDYTYQPRTSGGKIFTELASVPVNIAKAMFSSTGGDVGQLVGGTKGRAIGESIGDVAPDIAATLYGGRAALRSFKPVSAAEVPAPQIAPPVLGTKLDVPTYLRNQFAERQAAQNAAMAPKAPTPEITAPIAIKDAESMRPGAQDDTGQKLLPKADQAERAAILQRIGLENARSSAINGDGFAAHVEAQTSKFPQPAGAVAREQFNVENSALQNHAQQIIKDTGGTIGTDEATLGSRGQAIAAPFDALRNWFDEH